MLATTKQISYLQDLADKAQVMKGRHPSLLPLGLYPQTFRLGMTSEQVSLRIKMYQAILHACYCAIYPWYRKQMESEDLPA